MLKTTTFRALEKSIAFLLQRDPNSVARLKTLDGKIILLDITDLRLKMYWLFEDEKILLRTEWSEPVDASIRGPLSALMDLHFRRHHVSADLSISGNLDAIEAFKNVFAQLDIDWGAQLAPFVGDAAAFKLEQFAERGMKFFNRFLTSTRENTKEYLEEEVELLPSRHRFDDFAQQVRSAARATDRLEARIKRLLRERAS